MNGLNGHARDLARNGNGNGKRAQTITANEAALAAPAPTLQLRDYAPSDRATVIGLLAQGRPAHYRRMKEAIFDWQFDANPDDDGRRPFIVGTVDDEIVAVNGFMPAKGRYQDGPLQASWSCDTYVAAKFRGHGFGKKLIRAVSARAPVMLGYGISDMSDPIFDKQGWALHPAARLLIFHVREPGLKGTIKDLCSQAVKHIRSLQHALPRSPRLDITLHDEDFGAGVDELWQRSAPGYFSAVHRDAAYLNWKYRRHPLEKYSWYGAHEGGKLRGLVVARHSRKASVLVDYCGPADDVALMSGLVAEATADMAQRGTMRVQCETTHAPLLAALERAGYIGSHHLPRFRVRTNLPGDVRALEGWFMMAGDSDGDMINNDSDAALAIHSPSPATPHLGPILA